MNKKILTALIAAAFAAILLPSASGQMIDRASTSVSATRTAGMDRCRRHRRRHHRHHHHHHHHHHHWKK